VARRDVLLSVLRDHLADLVISVPYFRDRDDHYDPSRVRTWRAFSSLPIMERDDVRAAYPLQLVRDGIDLQGGLKNGSLELLQSSGSTGSGAERVTVLADTSIRGAPDDDLALWDLLPDPRLQRVLVYTSPACAGRICEVSDKPGRLRFGGLRLVLRAQQDPFTLERDDVARTVDEIVEHDAAMWFANPTWLHALLRQARAFNIEVPPAALACTTFQRTSHRDWAFISSTLSAKVYSTYGASEFGRAVAALECKRGRLHVWQDHCYVEVVDDNDQPVPAGVVGQLIVTPHRSKVTPLVRYRVGDVGAVVHEACDCVLAAHPTLHLEGRHSETLMRGRRRLSARTVDDAFVAVPGIAFFQLHEDSDGSVRIDVIPDDATALSTSMLLDAAHALGLANVQVREVEELYTAPSGKVPTIVPYRR
jgi:phenylacetate-CoA ligase